MKSRAARSQQLNNHYKREGGVRSGGGSQTRTRICAQTSDFLSSPFVLDADAKSPQAC